MICLFGWHAWLTWRDVADVVFTHPDGGVTATGIKQERRCRRCNRVDMRVVAA